ncbi:hypothetical protein [uncultured Desulfuromonas sp.]|uniref:hypothetical protein n=1 Tax=uncultured Desulfuromonas sp. TaxID=181013 RepID=UPI002AAAB065|nr:hypothetical protein [uncultured Desulfuromonas sp.]
MTAIDIFTTGKGEKRNIRLYRGIEHHIEEIMKEEGCNDYTAIVNRLIVHGLCATNRTQMSH